MERGPLDAKIGLAGRPIANGLTASGIQLWGFSPRCFIQAPTITL